MNVELPTDENPVKVVEGDCLEALPRLMSAGVACVITDPPYGISLKSNGTRFRSARPIDNDESQEVGQAAIDWCFENGLPACVFADPLKPWRDDWRQALAWDKGGAVGIGGDRATCWKRSWELVQVSRLFGALNGARDESVLQFPMMPADSEKHPAAKSLKLMRYLVRKLTAPDDIILDCFAGSGTTGVASALEGRRCILIEKDAKYAQLCRDRIARVMDAGMFNGLDCE